VICPAYTCVVVPHAIVLSGNIPVFVDCEKNSFNMSYDGIKKAITDKTKAIIVTHLFGYPMDVLRVNSIIKDAEKKYRHKIYIIQDVAHSFGGRWQGELVTKFGDAALFGLNISKTINSIFGGMVIGNDQKTYQKLKEYREENFIKQGLKRTFKRFLYLISVYYAFNEYIYSFTNWLERKGFIDSFTKYYSEDKINFPKDWNHYPSEIEAKVGLVQLKKYDSIISKKLEQANGYKEDFNGKGNIKILSSAGGATYSHFVALVENRDEWIKRYLKKGIELGILIEYAVPYMPAYAKYKNGEYPISKYYSQHTINFPNWVGLKKR